MYQITVKELREKLEAFEHIGMGNWKVWCDMDWTVEHYILDTNENNIVKN